jgi:hypothetical protein
MAKSRLSKSQEKKALNKIILSIVGIIIVIIILVKVAIPGLINFSLFLANLRGDNTTTSSTSKNSTSYVMPPIFTTNFTATNSATINLAGTAPLKGQVILYINNNPADTTDVKNDGTFMFKNVTLVPGVNAIKAKAKVNNKLSDFSDTLSITYGNKAPTLTVDTPHDGDTVHQATIQVYGKTDPDDQVTVNGFIAIVDTNGQYSYNLSLQNGDNQIKIIAQDTAGNQTEKDLKVTYNQ